MFTYNYGQEHAWMRQGLATKQVRVRVTNRANVVTFDCSTDGNSWARHP